jgi:hypothetical protein
MKQAIATAWGADSAITDMPTARMPGSIHTVIRRSLEEQGP